MFVHGSKQLTCCNPRFARPSRHVGVTPGALTEVCQGKGYTANGRFNSILVDLDLYISIADQMINHDSMI